MTGSGGVLRIAAPSAVSFRLEVLGLEAERASSWAESEARWSGWMRRANAGDGLAYQDLLREVGQAAEAYLRRHFGDGDFLEDCVQECLLAIHRARETWDPRRSFRPWLFTIVRHKAIDFLRRRGARARGEVDGSDAPGTAVAGRTSSSADDRIEVAALLSRLEPKYRDALVLTKLRGYSLSEAAAEIGVSTPAMKTRVHRAIAKAQRLLEVEET